jgi:hypothetical protein
MAKIEHKTFQSPAGDTNVGVGARPLGHPSLVGKAMVAMCR